MSEPEHIKDILPVVLTDIGDRRRNHRHGVMAAVGDFLAGKSKHPKEQRRIQKGKAETDLFSKAKP